MADEKDVQRAIQQHAGDAFLVNTVHVPRDKKGGKAGEKEVKSIAGGRLLSELKGDEKLDSTEVEEFEKQGAIRPAMPDDIRAGHAREAARETAATEREKRLAFQGVDAEQAAERQAIIDKHNAARDKELSALAEKHEAARAKVAKKFEPAAAGSK